ncbi:hypothetical protein [Paraburkholderia strydomiana]|uniref:hypothetical protein n=1 Tax=Paraburkholderia strydomiana TaxID=1245417 RepID=UPI00285B10FD|nr:hypothetical protein [Paraburkholderia strydomiana]MDR7008842.1 ABC-type iron transport system FetAB ATPase subunit [Paraburkholderia strydomiana]
MKPQFGVIFRGGNVKSAYEERLRSMVERLCGAADVLGATVDEQIALANQLSARIAGDATPRAMTVPESRSLAA